MYQATFTLTYEVYNSSDELTEQDRFLLAEARKTTGNAYAPYSKFQVGAVARLVNGEQVTGSNQENASFPAGLCAERALLATASSIYPETAIDTIAISYNNNEGSSDHPVSPCGICRQSLQEFEQRTHHPIRLILSGMEGKVFIIRQSALLLPLAFTANELL